MKIPNSWPGFAWLYDSKIGEFRKLRLLNLFLLVSVSLLYVLLSTRYSGPAYLADEIGYLSNAAFLAGYHSDGASSYYAGYSFLIAPIFRLASDPSVVWMGILVVNGLLWGATIALVSMLQARLMPNTPVGRHLAILTVVGLYPAFLTMSGYAFSQSAFAFFFACSLYSLTALNPAKPRSVLLHSAFVAYLSWIHPLGLAVCVASVTVILCIGLRTRHRSVGWVNLLAISMLVAAYQFWIHPWMIDGMTPIGANANLHYPSVSAISGAHVGLERVKMLVGLMMGQTAYLLVATFGFFGAGAVWLLGECRAFFVKEPDASAVIEKSFNFSVAAFLLLSAAGVIGETVLTVVVAGYPDRIDHWIYGRYVEPTIALVLALGLAAKPKAGTSVIMAGFVLATGFWLTNNLAPSGPTYAMNVPGWWPIYLNHPLPLMGYFVVGAIGILAALIVGRSLSYIGMVLVYLVFCLLPQQQWHKNVLNIVSNPSSFVEFVDANYRNGQCIAFDTGSAAIAGLPEIARERANLYSFYFFSQPMKRLTPEQWMQSCAGPLLTFDPGLEGRLPGIRYVGRETASQLYLVVRSDRKLVFPANVSGEEVWSRTGSSDCLFAGCFEVDPLTVGQYQQVGKPSKQGIRTDSHAGFLIYGPYASLAKGSYVAELDGVFDVPDTAVLDVVSEHGKVVHVATALKDVIAPDRRFAKVRFKVDTPAKALELRVRVSSSSKLQISSYRIGLDTDAIPAEARISEPLPGKAGFVYQGDGLSELPRQVGVVQLDGIHADGNAGFLLYGPYKPLPAGRYMLRVFGLARSPMADSWMDVVSDHGNTTHLRSRLAEGTGLLAESEMLLQRDTKGVEVRIYSGKNASFIVRGYTLGRVDDADKAIP